MSADKLIGQTIKSIEYDEYHEWWPLKITFESGDILEVEAKGYDNYSLRLQISNQNEEHPEVGMFDDGYVALRHDLDRIANATSLSTVVLSSPLLVGMIVNNASK